jgi:hypothetical protein
MLISWRKLPLANQTPILVPMATPSKTSKEPMADTKNKQTNRKSELIACIPHIKATTFPH